MVVSRERTAIKCSLKGADKVAVTRITKRKKQYYHVGQVAKIQYSYIALYVFYKKTISRKKNTAENFTFSESIVIIYRQSIFYVKVAKLLIAE